MCLPKRKPGGVLAAALCWKNQDMLLTQPGSISRHNPQAQTHDPRIAYKQTLRLQSTGKVGVMWGTLAAAQ